MKVHQEIYLERRVKDEVGEVGIEIELEGKGLREIDPMRHWRSVHDGSLRGGLS